MLPQVLYHVVFKKIHSLINFHSLVRVAPSIRDLGQPCSWIVTSLASPNTVPTLETTRCSNSNSFPTDSDCIWKFLVSQLADYCPGLALFRWLLPSKTISCPICSWCLLCRSELQVCLMACASDFLVFVSWFILVAYYYSYTTLILVLY